MVKKYVYGRPVETEAAVVSLQETAGTPELGETSLTEGFCFRYTLAEEDMIFGLGEANRGINKRGYVYISDCTDDPDHTENKASLYGAHNFIAVSGKTCFGLFFDYPGRLRFDIGYTDSRVMEISCADANLAVYVIEGTDAYDIVKQFRKLIGRSYIPPKFAFGYGQSRWGYRTPEDFRAVADGYRENHIPLDLIYMDIDYMENYKDFTWNPENFPDFGAFVREMKARNIRLIPIIDAGVKVEQGYSVYEEGVKNGYFCKKEDGSEFTVAVWPGYTHLPDVLNDDARRWFGDKYKILTDEGIEGFWNDMNEPAMFYTPEGIAEVKAAMRTFVENEPEKDAVWAMRDMTRGLANRAEDYAAFYHDRNSEKIRHDRIHNLYGYYMTKAAAEGLERINADKRFLLFSRSSYIGMHRYGGIWTGDNQSWWAHLLLNIRMMPSLNMCGFLYSGADLGGFGADTTRELLLRWLAFGIFTPLMRNHSAEGTRMQEAYRFERLEDFRNLIGVRYRLLPYLYSEYMKAALNDDLYFKPMAFVYPQDPIARETEDQLIIGNEIMVAPVYTQNAKGRVVYFPEEMRMVKFCADGSIAEEVFRQGYHYVETGLGEAALFIRKGRCIPIGAAVECVEQLDKASLAVYGWEGAAYTLYDDDGISKNWDMEKNCTVMKR